LADVMNEIKNTTKIVKEILTESEAARNSDTVLYIRVCEKLNPAVLWHPFLDVIVTLKENGLPPFETVSRARRKIQAKHPELAGSERVTVARAEKEEVFREYAREG